MAEFKIRNVDEQLAEFYRDRAAQRGVSLEEELRQTLGEVRRRERQEAAKSVSRHLAAMREKYGEMPDSTPGIRADRDERG